MHRWLGCVCSPTEFTEFTEVLLRKSSHRIHGIHRSFVASVLPRNSRNSQKLGCVSPPTDFTDLHRWLVALFAHGIHGIHRSFVASILPRNSRNSQKLGCVSPPTDFTDLHRWLVALFAHGIHGIHRSFGVLLAAWVRQDAIPSYICVNPCYLWETILCKKLLCVPWVLWEYSLPRISQINTDGWLRLFSHGIHRIMVGCVNSPTEFTEFTEVWGGCWLRGYGRMPYPPNLCASVPIRGRYFSARRFCVFCAFCGNIVSHGFHRSTQMVGCVNSPTDFTEFTEVWGCCWLRGYGRMPYPPTSV